MINWVVQKNLTKPAIVEKIKSALYKRDESWEEIEVIPFSTKLPDIKNPLAFPVVYGSTTLMLNAFDHDLLKKGVFFDPFKFNMAHYVQKWGSRVLNCNGTLIPLGKVNDLQHSSNEKLFIRPNDDGKDFNGKVDTFEALIEWSTSICKLKLPDFNAYTEVWISKPKTILKEWRLFIVDDSVVSTSRYMLNGELNISTHDVPSQMLNFANECIQTYRLADVYVMDIAELEEGYKLIECNCFNGTGFYSHDIEKIVFSINSWIRNNHL
ncbi:MAG: ATP-grasp domain-containing protein [Saprospiraceae bacterium]|nr:ATP-grasp domain-containing protein [Saprospiraceae bacterium]